MRACDDNKLGEGIMLDECIGIQACFLQQVKKKKKIPDIRSLRSKTKFTSYRPWGCRQQPICVSMWHAVIFSHLQYEWGSGSLMLLLIENKQRDGDFLTRLPCMIYDSECSEDKGSINVIWPFQPRVTVVTLFWPWIVISQKAVGISINCMILLHNTLISVGLRWPFLSGRYSLFPPHLLWDSNSRPECLLSGPAVGFPLWISHSFTKSHPKNKVLAQP